MPYFATRSPEPAPRRMPPRCATRCGTFRGRVTVVELRRGPDGWFSRAGSRWGGRPGIAPSGPIRSRAPSPLDFPGRHLLLLRRPTGLRRVRVPPVARGPGRGVSHPQSAGVRLDLGPVSDLPPLLTAGADRADAFRSMIDTAGPDLAGRLRDCTVGTVRGVAGLPNQSAAPPDPAGRWTVTPGTTVTRSPVTASATPSATPNCWPRRSTTRYPVRSASSRRSRVTRGRRSRECPASPRCSGGSARRSSERRSSSSGDPSSAASTAVVQTHLPWQARFRESARSRAGDRVVSEGNTRTPAADRMPSNEASRVTGPRGRGPGSDSVALRGLPGRHRRPGDPSGGRLVPVEPPVFDVLVMLIRERHRVVTTGGVVDRRLGDPFRRRVRPDQPDQGPAPSPRGRRSLPACDPNRPRSRMSIRRHGGTGRALERVDERAVCENVDGSMGSATDPTMGTLS